MSHCVSLPLVSYSLNFCSYEDSENRRGLGDPELADEGDVQMDYSSDKLYNPSIGIVTITCETLGQYRYLLITQCIQ